MQACVHARATPHPRMRRNAASAAPERAAGGGREVDGARVCAWSLLGGLPLILLLLPELQHEELQLVDRVPVLGRVRGLGNVLVRDVISAARGLRMRPMPTQTRLASEVRIGAAANSVRCDADFGCRSRRRGRRRRRRPCRGKCRRNAPFRKFDSIPLGGPSLRRSTRLRAGGVRCSGIRRCNTTNTTAAASPWARHRLL